MTEQRGYAAWLNSLSEPEALRLDNLMRQHIGLRDDSPVKVVGLDADRLAECSALEGCHSGEWWVNHCTCEVAGIGGGNSSHPRWQLNFTSGKGVSTPSKMMKGERPVLEQLKGCVSQAHWQSLKDTVVTNVGSSTQKYSVKLDVHHVSYVASHQRWEGEGKPLPDNLGAGGSVDHLCDTSGCIRHSHLMACAHHASNLARQRCLGCTVAVCGNVIIHEQVCSHGVVNGVPDFDMACTRVNVVKVPTSLFTQGQVERVNELLNLPD